MSILQKLKNAFKIESGSEKLAPGDDPHKRVLKTRESRRDMGKKSIKAEEVSKTDLETEFAAITKDIEQKSLELKNLEISLAEKEQQEKNSSDTYTKQISELEGILASLKKDLQEESTKSESLIKTLADAYSKKQSVLKSQNADLKEKVIQGREKVIQLETSIISKKSESSQIDEMKHLKEREEREKKNLSRQVEIEKSNELLDIQNNELRKSIQELEESISKIQLERDLQEKSCKQERVKLETEVEYLIRDEIEQSKALEALNVKTAGIKDKIKASEIEIKGLQLSIDDIKRNRDDLSKTLETKKELGLIDKLVERINKNEVNLLEVDLSGQKITDQDVAKLLTALKTNRLITKLVLKLTPITGDGFTTEIAQLLTLNTPLEYLSFENCKISRTTIDAILKVIPDNTSLTDLFLGDLETDSDIDIFDSVLQTNFETKYPDN